MASILQGTPINTLGIHPLAALMGQGGEIMSRAFSGAAQTAARNTAVTVGFMRDAMQERINMERNALEKRNQDMQYALKQQQMDQQRELTMAELASRERSQQLRASMASRAGSGGSGGGGSDPQAAQVSAILGQIFQAPAGARQAQPQAPQGAPVYGPTQSNAMIAPADGAMGTGEGRIVAYQQLKEAEPQVQASVSNALDRDLNAPENADSLEQAFQKKMQIDMVGMALSPTVAGQLSYASKAAYTNIQMEQYRQSRAKESGADLNGLSVIDKAIGDTVSPFDGFTGKRFSTEQDLEAALQDPDTRKAVGLLQIPSAQLRRGLTNNPPPLDELATLSDQYNAAAKSVDMQESEAMFLMSERKSKEGSLVDGRNIIKDRLSDPRTPTGVIRGHQEVLDQAFSERLKSAKLEELSPSTVARARLSAEQSLAAAESKARLANGHVESVEKKLDGMLPKDWGYFQLNEEIEKEHTGDGYTARGMTLKSLKSEYDRAKDDARKASDSESVWVAQTARISEYARHAASGITPGEFEGQTFEGETPPPQETPSILEGKVNDAFNRVQKAKSLFPSGD